MELTASLTDVYSFNSVLEAACEKLMERQAIHSIRRIREMEERLSDLEQELEFFLNGRNRKRL